MDMSSIDVGLLMMFVVLTVINVILNTARTIITVRGGMFWSSLIAAIAFGFYTIVIIYTVCDLPMWMKATVTALANFVGTYLVKYVEMKMRKERLWMVDVVLTGPQIYAAKSYLDPWKIQYTEIPISNSDSSQFHIYSKTQDESRRIRDLLKTYNAKYVVVESKSL
jgi:hypothetical protein